MTGQPYRNSLSRIWFSDVDWNGTGQRGVSPWGRATLPGLVPDTKRVSFGHATSPTAVVVCRSW